MKKLRYVLLLAASMFVVSCDNGDQFGDNNYDDPFLNDDIIACTEGENEGNVKAFIEILTEGCLLQNGLYFKDADEKWQFSNNPLGASIPSYTLLDEHTLLCRWANINSNPQDNTVPFQPYTFTKHSIYFDYSTGVITTVLIGKDGSLGETYSCNLYITKDGYFVCDGPFCGHIWTVTTPNGKEKRDARWCLEKRDQHTEILEGYAKWLSEQEQE